MLKALSSRMFASPTRSFSSLQPFPHRSFDSEVEYLQRFFSEGEACILGRHGGADTQHHVFVASYANTPVSPLS